MDLLQDRKDIAKALWNWFNHPNSEGFSYKLFGLFAATKFQREYQERLSVAFPLAFEMWSALESSVDRLQYFHNLGVIQLPPVERKYSDAGTLVEKDVFRSDGKKPA